MPDTVVARALLDFVGGRLVQAESARGFIKLEGFEDYYSDLLKLIRQTQGQVGGRTLIVKSTDAINDYPETTIEPERTPTYYRNHLAANETLLLIINKRTPDAQSLNPLYSVSETTLTDGAGLDCLIDASFYKYQLRPDDRKSLIRFLRTYRQAITSPQLRDLADYLAALHNSLYNREPFLEALGTNLPHLGLFAFRGLGHIIENRGKLEAQFRNLYRAALIGRSAQEEKEVGKLCDQLDKAHEAGLFRDDSRMGGKSAKEKYAALKRFIVRTLPFKEQREVLQLDWSEVEAALFRPIRKPKTEQLRALSDQLSTVLNQSDLTSQAQEVLEDLANGKVSNPDVVQDMVDEYGQDLGTSLTRQLKKLVDTQIVTTSDFLHGCVMAALELSSRHRDDLVDGVLLRVRFLSANSKGRRDQAARNIAEACQSFLVLYGGIDTLWSEVKWELGGINKQAILDNANEADDSEGALDERTHQTASLTFRIELKGLAHNEKSSQIELNWVYRSDSSQALSCQAIEWLHHNNMSLPIFATLKPHQEIGDLNLRQPMQSLGTYYRGSRNLEKEFLVAIQHEVSSEAFQQLTDTLASLRTSWSEFLAQSLKQGLFSAFTDHLVNAYEQALIMIGTHLQTARSATYGLRVLNQGWIIQTQEPGDWAVVPLLHPLKLMWWLNRAGAFRNILVQLLNPLRPTEPVNDSRFKSRFAHTYSSAGFPAVVVLPDDSGSGRTLMPVDEVDGYELFRVLGSATMAQGLHGASMTEIETDQEADKAASDIASIVGDYLETYPFVRDGLELYLVGSRNATLPCLLIERLATMTKRRGQPRLKLSLVIQTDSLGAPLYDRVWDWVKDNDDLNARMDGEYFPAVTIQVLECSATELINKYLHSSNGRSDLVILADVLRERGQSVEIGQTQRSAVREIDRHRFVPFSPMYRSLPLPFERGELARISLLNPDPLPSVVVAFYNTQAAFGLRRPIDVGAARFELRYALNLWEPLLSKLHSSFNWVVCYDQVVDRFLLEHTIPDSVQVIRYSLGRGVKGQHNLTASSAGWSREIVERRLAGRLRHLVPALGGAASNIADAIARALVTSASAISGDIVLRAAGPGSFLNELIGLVIAKELAEESLRREFPNALVTSIYLDDFEHWFSGRQPDLLLLGIVEIDGRLQLHSQVLEAKCVSEQSFDHEWPDAEHQVIVGLNVLGRAFLPGRQFLDADYWYDQLYRALAGNTMIQKDHRDLWGLLRERLTDGEYELVISGHSWVFVYDGPGGTRGSAQTLDVLSDKNADDVEAAPIYRHWRGRSALADALVDLAERHHIQLPSDAKSIPTLDGSLETSMNDATPASGEMDRHRRGQDPQSISKEEASAEATTRPQSGSASVDTDSHQIEEQAREIDRVLRQYKIGALPVDPSLVDIGPSVLRYKVRLKPGQKQESLNRILHDVARELALHNTPLLAAVPGTKFVGLDIPRRERELLPLLPLVDQLPIPVPGHLHFLAGKTPNGQVIVKDLAMLPHLLVAGTTGSGKTVFLQGILLSLLHRLSARQLSLLIIDPKRTDFAIFNPLPHLRGGAVINDPEAAIQELHSLTDAELETRTEMMIDAGVQNLLEYNQHMADDPLRPIVVLIDEYADLIDVLTKAERQAFEIEMQRLAQRARSVGIHLIIATQRPTADVVTGRLKANLPARVAFRLPASRDSLVILDDPGAENLLGKGDMLFLEDGVKTRMQGFFTNTPDLRAFARKVSQ